MKRVWTVLGALALVVGLTACGLQAPERVNIVETLQAEGFDSLVGLVTEVLDADTIAALASDEGAFTVFAPTDEAIESFLAAVAEREDVDIEAEGLVETVLLYHVLVGRFAPQVLIAAGSKATLTEDGLPLFFDADGPGWALNQATQNVSVVGGPMQATNGSIYVIDQVLLPPTIADIAILSPDFNVLVAALVEADLVGAVSRYDTPLTVFAPTDAAFGALLEALEATPEQLLARDDLADILRYHVVAGELRAAAVVAAVTSSDGGTYSAPTLEGRSIDVTIVDGGVVLNGTVNVIVTDVIAANGVIHVIDAVLLPPVEPSKF